MVLQILLILLFLVVIASVIMISSVYVVRQQSVAIIERFGKYQKLSNSGIHGGSLEITLTFLQLHRACLVAVNHAPLSLAGGRHQHLFNDLRQRLR